MNAERLARELFDISEAALCHQVGGASVPRNWNALSVRTRNLFIASAANFLDKYNIREKSLSLEQKREQVRKGNPDAVRYGGKSNVIVSIEPPTTGNSKGKTYKL